MLPPSHRIVLPPPSHEKKKNSLELCYLHHIIQCTWIEIARYVSNTKTTQPIKKTADNINNFEPRLVLELETTINHELNLKRQQIF